MFDKEKANLCVSKMKDYFADNKQSANVEIPIDIAPESNEYIIYLFYSCLLDYGMRSKIYHTNLIDTYKKDKNIFNPKYVVENYIGKEEKLLDIIKGNIHPRYPNIACKKWIELSKFLDTNYPQNKLKEKIVSFQSYKELYCFITSIKGYGQKTGGLLLRLIFESGICKFQNDIKDIPIDRHDVEISYLNGIINKEKLNNNELKELGRVWIEAAITNHVSACDIDKYLWSIGNQLCAKKDCLICPLTDYCKRKI